MGNELIYARLRLARKEQERRAETLFPRGLAEGYGKQEAKQAKQP